MKDLSTLILLFVSASLLSQTVPNGGFEEWEVTPQFSLDPVGWETDNTQLIVSTSQDMEPYQGMYAMKVEPIMNGIGEYGEASVTLDMGGLPDGLFFQAKYWRTFTAGVGVTVDFYYEEDIVHTQSWYPTDTASSWMQAQMTFPPIDIATTHAIIRVFVAIGDFAPGEGWISVDAMDFGFTTSTADQDRPQISLYPNPVSDRFVLEGVDSGTPFRIIDSQGRLVQQGVQGIENRLEDLSAGHYLLIIGEGEQRIPLQVE